MIIVSAFKSVPPFARGLVRDLRVRWALEEAGLDYDQKLLGDGEKDSADYRAWQPFGQVPAHEERNGGEPLRLFESGAIVLHIGEKPEASDALLPADPGGKARAVQWLLAALNSVEPHVQHLTAIDLFYASEEWAKLRRPSAEQMAKVRLAAVAAALGEGEWLTDGRFTAGDLMMATVLRIARHTELVKEASLADYLARCEARPAFRRALDAQMAVFQDA
jgi:glutathione S-transferase